MKPIFQFFEIALPYIIQSMFFENPKNNDIYSIELEAKHTNKISKKLPIKRGWISSDSIFLSRVNFFAKILNAAPVEISISLQIFFIFCFVSLSILKLAATFPT